MLFYCTPNALGEKGEFRIGISTKEVNTIIVDSCLCLLPLSSHLELIYIFLRNQEVRFGWEVVGGVFLSDSVHMLAHSYLQSNE